MVQLRQIVACGGRFIAIAAILTVAGCDSPRPPHENLPRLLVLTQFRVENLCSMGVSPEIKLSNVPDGTKSYTVQITDINVLITTPWREQIPLTSKTDIPEGAAKTYIGPCLGDMTRFAPSTTSGYQHRVEVLAQDASGKPLAYGLTVVSVESPYITAKRERAGQQPPLQDLYVAPTTTPLMQYGTQYGGFWNPGFPANQGLVTTQPYP